MVGQIKVMSKRHLSNEWGWLDIVGDRSSMLGNPFELIEESQRHTICMTYREWLWANHCQVQINPKARVSLDKWTVRELKIAPTFKNPTSEQVMLACDKIVSCLREGRDIRLICWCHPKECHLDMLARYLGKRLDGTIASPFC